MDLIGTGLVGLRDTDRPKAQHQPQGKSVLYVKVDPDLKMYALTRGAPLLGGYTEFVVDAIKLDKDLESGLSAEVERIKAYAASRGLSTKTDLGQILSELAVKALDCIEGQAPCSQSKTKPKK